MLTLTLELHLGIIAYAVMYGQAPFMATYCI